MTGHGIAGAQEVVIRAALRCLSAERHDDSADTAAEAEYAYEQLALAARDLVYAVDGGPADQRPVGWFVR